MWLGLPSRDSPSLVSPGQREARPPRVATPPSGGVLAKWSAPLGHGLRWPGRRRIRPGWCARPPVPSLPQISALLLAFMSNLMGGLTHYGFGSAPARPPPSTVRTAFKERVLTN